MLPEKIIFISTGISLLCAFWYIRSVFRGGTRPNMISWLVWSLAPFIAVFLGYKAGGGISLLAPFMSGFGPLLIFIFCLFCKISGIMSRIGINCGITIGKRFYLRLQFWYELFILYCYLIHKGNAISRL